MHKLVDSTPLLRRLSCLFQIAAEICKKQAQIQHFLWRKLICKQKNKKEREGRGRKENQKGTFRKMSLYLILGDMLVLN